MQLLILLFLIPLGLVGLFVLTAYRSGAGEGEARGGTTLLLPWLLPVVLPLSGWWWQGQDPVQISSPLSWCWVAWVVVLTGLAFFGRRKGLVLGGIAQGVLATLASFVVQAAFSV